MRSKACPYGGFNLIIGDFPDGMPVPPISLHPTDVPNWNNYTKKDVEFVFEFADHFLHHQECIIAFAPECPEVRTDIISYANAYDFYMLREWWGINDLPLHSLVNPKVKVT